MRDDLRELWEWKELCMKDHMHRWERSATTTNLICVAEPRDNPDQQDEDEVEYLIENIEWTHVQGAKVLQGLVALAKGEMVAEIESSVLADLLREPVGFSDLLRTTTERYEDAIRLEDKRWRNSPFYKIMQQRGVEIRLLYGTMTNYFLVMDHKPQHEGAVSPRTSTNNQQQERSHHNGT